MKKFLSIQKFKEIKILFILELILILNISLIIYNTNNNFNINYFDWKALSLSLFIWLLSSFLDKERYFNFATLIGTGVVMYTCFWTMFNI